MSHVFRLGRVRPKQLQLLRHVTHRNVWSSGELATGPIKKVLVANRGQSCESHVNV